MYTSIIHPPRRCSLRLQWYDEETDTSNARSSGSHGRCDIITPDPIRDPLLCAIHHVMISLSPRGRLNVGNIATCIWLCDSQTKPQLASGHFRQPSPPLLICPKSRDRRTPNTISTAQSPRRAAPAHTIHLIRDNHATPRVPLIEWHIVG